MSWTLLAVICLLQVSGATVQDIAGGLKTFRLGFQDRPVASRLETAGPKSNIHGMPMGDYSYRAEFGWPPPGSTSVPVSIPSGMHETLRRRYPGNQNLIPRPPGTEWPLRARFAVLEVRNESAKTIKSVDWEFTYPHFKGDKEVLYYQANSRLKIPPGRMATLARELPRDDCRETHRISREGRWIRRVCGRTNPKHTGMYPVEVRINRVKYTDGSVWQAAP